MCLLYYRSVVEAWSQIYKINPFYNSDAELSKHTASIYQPRIRNLIMKPGPRVGATTEQQQQVSIARRMVAATI